MATMKAAAAEVSEEEQTSLAAITAAIKAAEEEEARLAAIKADTSMDPPAVRTNRSREDFLAILTGVREPDVEATAREVKANPEIRQELQRRYRSLAARYHPDQQRRLFGEEAQSGSQEYQHLNEAYSTLTREGGEGGSSSQATAASEPSEDGESGGSSGKREWKWSVDAPRPKGVSDIYRAAQQRAVSDYWQQR
uniref:J domain-containing protein n=1 Tax=Octactis speculum TaxID=3111310 RepID=A0A7S2D7G3_9STRA